MLFHNLFGSRRTYDEYIPDKLMYVSIYIYISGAMSIDVFLADAWQKRSITGARLVTYAEYSCNTATYAQYSLDTPCCSKVSLARK